MIEMSTAPIPVNPAGTDIELTRDDVWRGLMWKAEVPMPFVEPIVDCVVLEKFPDGFLRRIMHTTPDGPPEPIEERIILDPQHTVTFLRLSGSAVGRVINEIIEEPDGRLLLQFHFILALPGIEHASPEEDGYRTGFARGYLAAAETTLEALREMSRTGVDPTASLRSEPVA